MNHELITCLIGIRDLKWEHKGNLCRKTNRRNCQDVVCNHCLFNATPQIPKSYTPYIERIIEIWEIFHEPRTDSHSECSA